MGLAWYSYINGCISVYVLFLTDGHTSNEDETNSELNSGYSELLKLLILEISWLENMLNGKNKLKHTLEILSEKEKIENDLQM